MPESPRAWPSRQLTHTRPIVVQPGRAFAVDEPDTRTLLRQSNRAWHVGSVAARVDRHGEA